MKCPRCKFYSICKGRLNETVENCVRFKSVDETNDEWRRTCSTEDFAEFLTGVAHAGAYEARNCNTNGMLQTQNTDFWFAWLKEKHQ